VNRLMISAMALASLLLAFAANPAVAWDRGDTDVFAIVPEVLGTPIAVEGLTVGPDGNIYVPTSGFNTHSAGNGPPTLFVFQPNGQLLRQVTITGPATPVLLGLAFHPTTGALLICDLGGKQVVEVDPHTGVSSVFMTTTGNAGMNGITFDKMGNVYASDSFQGIIWKTGPGGGAGAKWVEHPLLRPDGPNLAPPFGANGIEFNNAGTTLFVANTADHNIVQVPVLSGGAAGTPQIFVTGLNAPDGLAIDSHDNLWVAANQEDDMVVVDPTGKVIAKLGDFDGLTEDGVVRGLLFPASPAFSKDGKFLYVTNLALDLRVAGAPLAVDSAWTDQVKHYSIAKMSTHIRSGFED
jgi:sugar lactone lactonase YvrE